MIALLALACAGKAGDSGADSPDAAPAWYEVRWQVSPDPLQAGAAGTFTLQVTDDVGVPIEDLQQNHERMVHTLFISEDLATFQHLHHEDFAALSAEDLRSATFTFPLTLPQAGPYRLAFDFAHRDTYQSRQDQLVVEGSPGQADAPQIPTEDVVSDGDLTGALAWDSPPIAGYEAAFTLSLTDAAGAPVTDLVQWLGADAHAAVVSADLSDVGHTHAWFPGMDEMGPGMVMPQVYTGPTVPFHYTFARAGSHKIWVQLARAADPSRVYLLPFGVEVGG
jgi:hypothetical protein